MNIVRCIIHYLKQLSVVLQGRQQDIGCGYQHIKLAETQLLCFVTCIHVFTN